MPKRQLSVRGARGWTGCRWLPLAFVGLLMVAGGCGRSTTRGQVAVADQERDCQNGVDDDIDGLLDCQDPDCALAPECVSGGENCGNGIDDDGDGRVDCQDSDCFQHPLCVGPGTENCVNRRDDDGDGLIDCNDPDCRTHPDCLAPGKEDCQNGLDDDGDGLIDCQDADCFADPTCGGRTELCDNGRDDDGDGLIDCNDPDCFTHPVCNPGQEDCQNGRDDDGDGLIDCADPDCLGHPQCGTVENCVNLKDDDNDALIDCDDPDCATHPACAVQNENCTNGRDDDNDGLRDCNDPDCFKHPACKTPGQEICNNGIDDDEDGLIDCDDFDCAGLSICQVGREDCQNRVDDDGDGAVDCDDPDCVNDTACQSLLCKPAVDFGDIASQGANVTRDFNTTGRPDTYASPCAVPGGGEVVAHFRLADAVDLKLSYDQSSGDHVIGIFRAGVGEACNANPVQCLDPDSAKQGSFSIKQLPAGDYYVLVEAFAARLEGRVSLTLETQSVAQPEDCKNGIDDDGDGAIDCADLDCVLTSGCATQNCHVDENVGTLVINGPAKRVTVSTRADSNEVEERCAAGQGGDKVVRFVMPQAGGVDVTVQQSGWHVFGFHQDQGPGTTCIADPGSCFDSNGSRSFTVEYGSVEKGVYYYVVDALDPNNEGTVALEFRAFKPRGPELCANGIDDDGDGLVDCLDPDCTGVVGCPGPVCSADFRSGPLVIGDAPITFDVDTTTANNDQTVSCALGGGKDQVIEVELTQVSGLLISCTQQSGDHVIGLFSAGQPRDPCDKNPESCADPKTGTLGCNFIFPNLQPGKYYLVLEAFQPGKEGRMSVSLAATPDHAQEICNNGIDDDNDGKVDCQDSNCSSKPICQGQTCTPDQKLGLIIKNGPVVTAAASTVGAGDKAATSCAQGGGEDSVLGFTLAEPATISIDYAQFGTHAFAIFDDKGQGFACDAVPRECKTTSVSGGTVSFTQLPAGQYFLVMEAVASGSEGAAVLRIQAK